MEVVLDGGISEAEVPFDCCNRCGSFLSCVPIDRIRLADCDEFYQSIMGYASWILKHRLQFEYERRFFEASELKRVF